MAKSRLDIVKDKAPVIPPNTCPYIDFVIDMLEDYNLMNNAVDIQRKDCILTMLEYVRNSNDSLRKSSKFWYDEYVKVVKRN